MPEPLFTKWTHVSPQDLVKSRSRKLLVYTFPIAMKFDGYLGSSVAEHSKYPYVSHGISPLASHILISSCHLITKTGVFHKRLASFPWQWYLWQKIQTFMTQNSHSRRHIELKNNGHGNRHHPYVSGGIPKTHGDANTHQVNSCNGLLNHNINQCWLSLIWIPTNQCFYLWTFGSVYMIFHPRKNVI